MFKKRKPHLALLVAALTATSGLYLTATTAAADHCTTAEHLAGSAFEIDTDANGADLKAEDANCIDWLDGSGGVRGKKKKDHLSGATDDSFGEGTSEDDPVPTPVDGSIPPNKSDLSWFGVNTETAGGEQFLQLFWSRVQNPKGTTNMDFELNKLGCFPEEDEIEGCSTNDVTPRRTVDDLLITYELSKGGTFPAISIWKWNGSNWVGPNELSTEDAIGSVNRKTILQADANDIGANKDGGLDPFTFGEASISFDALFPPGTCGGFGSAYLKSRSSDSFTSAMKDFIAPMRVDINNCPAPITTAQFLIPQDTATVGEPGVPATGKVTFNLYSDATCDTLVYEDVLVDLDSDGQASTTNSGIAAQGGFSVTASDNGTTYYWVVHYHGDDNYKASSTSCGDEVFTVDITD
jgi:hypothetical protein